MNGKGSVYRPVDQKKWDENYEAIFGKGRTPVEPVEIRFNGRLRKAWPKGEVPRKKVGCVVLVVDGTGNKQFYQHTKEGVRRLFVYKEVNSVPHLRDTGEVLESI